VHPVSVTDVRARLGHRVRALRDERGWTRRALAERTGLSERFLAQVEAGEGNPSIVSVAQIAQALDTSESELLAAPARGAFVALLGLRGAGKTTVGKALAAKLHLKFIELDRRVEQAAGLSLGELFELHGADTFRRLEREALQAVLAREPGAVIAAGGGLVNERETFDVLRRGATTVWLKAAPEDHWQRVVAQGDQRPMANDPAAMARLRALLAEREPLYRKADHVVDTSSASVDAIVRKLARLVAPKERAA